MVVQYKDLSRRDYLYKFLEIIDCMQLDNSKRTTDREKRIIVGFYTLPESFKLYRFGRLGKAELKRVSTLNGWPLTTQNLNNKIYSLLDKQILWRDEDGVIYAKRWLEKAIEEFEAALKNDSHYDFKFRFGNEKT